LKLYHEKLQAIKGNVYKLYTYQKRTEYYLYLLQYDFKRAIKTIKALQKDTVYKYNDQDQQNLADAYFNGGQPDSAIKIIKELLAQPLELNHPEIKFHLYKVLGQIAESRKDRKLAAYYFKLSLEQSEDVISRLTQVGNISSQIKIDEIEGSYLQKDEKYKRERLWLMFAVVVALLIIVIIAMFYRSAKQKTHYEKLLFTAQKEELAFINSHEVRKHLSNILGIMDVIKSSDDKENEYRQVEEYLFCSATSMDEAIKSISAKLDEHIPHVNKFTAPNLPSNVADKCEERAYEV
jgi:tetratricopeptide (TPR) repeat protein